MTVLITGADGFIGSYLANFFLQDGHSVIATSRQFHVSTSTLLKDAQLIDLDVLNNHQLQSISAQADVIIHTATANDIISKNAIKGIELSAIGTKNILEFAVKNKIPKCIVFSTLQVYGTELTGDISETSPLHFQNDYGLNHLFAEMYAEQYHRQNKIKCAIVRPSNVYGKILTNSFNRWSLVPGSFCKEALESGAITIKSSGLQMRNFINLENLALAISCILKDNMDNFEVYNAGSTEHKTMLQAAEIVKNVFEKNLNRKVELKVEGIEPSKTNTFNLSIDKLKKKGFVENKDFNLESGIKEIFNYLQNK
ncbi:MAG: NAD(P)-dependent oxidoreductase [Ferruginibacter sp.]